MDGRPGWGINDDSNLIYQSSHRAGSSGAFGSFGARFLGAGAMGGAPRLGRGRSSFPREGVSTVSDEGETGEGRGETRDWLLELLPLEDIVRSEEKGVCVYSGWCCGMRWEHASWLLWMLVVVEAKQASEQRLSGR